MTLKQISNKLRSLADPEIAEHSQRFFKTGKGEYGEGDQFLGIRVPVLREQAKRYQDIALEDIQRLLQSVFHEERLCAVLLLVRKFDKGNTKERTAIYKLYLKNIRNINNWDLVDSSAQYIVGAYLENRSRQILYKLAKSDSLWERRIAVMATFHFIKMNQFEEMLNLAKQLIDDEADLIHKAIGWMLREIGKRDVAVEKTFLKAHYQRMPRIMLRYAIEKFTKEERQRYLAGMV